MPDLLGERARAGTPMRRADARRTARARLAHEAARTAATSTMATSTDADREIDRGPVGIVTPGSGVLVASELCDLCQP